MFGIKQNQIRRNYCQKKIKQANKKLNKVLDYQYVDNDFYDELDNIILAEKKVRNNRKTHKSRLKDLKKNKEFS